jgi:protein-disulfide isomerase
MPPAKKPSKAALAKKKSDRSFVTMIVALLVVGAGVIGYVVFKPKPNAVVANDADTPLPQASGYVMGSESAPVEIVEFGDFECPGCGQFAVVTEPDVRDRLVKTGLARFRFMDFPLAQHLSAMAAHNAAACAGAQNKDKFWEMHDKIFLGQPEWSHFANGRDMNAPKVMKRYAKEIGLDEAAFATCLDNREHEPQIRANVAEGVKQGVAQTPTFIVGSQRVPGAQPYDVIKKMVDAATEAAKRAPAGKALGDTAVRK